MSAKTKPANQQSNAARTKLIYGGCIMVLFVVMFYYNQFLAERKVDDYKLDESALGKIDSDSFMLKIAQLCGMRGVTANVLWMQSINLSRSHEWDKMANTVDRITTLQPHFLSVWSFQGWNLAYNVSVEWDAPEDKYSWIKKGVNFLKRGVTKNEKSPDLLWDTAWTYYHKFGSADEAVILRRLLVDDTDEDFKRVNYVDPTRSSDERSVIYDDNFQLSRGWFYKAINLIDKGENRLFTGGGSENDLPMEFVDPIKQRKGRPNDLVFFTKAASAQTKYAESLEKTSVLGRPARFGEVAQLQWERAIEDWELFGIRSFEVGNHLTDDEGNYELVQIGDSLYPDRLEQLSDNQAYWTERWGRQVNYPYWYERAQAESTEEGVEARRYFYEGSIAYKLGEFEAAVDKFQSGLIIWEDLLRDYPNFGRATLSQENNGLLAKRYILALRQLGEEADEDTPFLQEALELSEDVQLDPFDAIDMGLVSEAELTNALQGSN